MTTTRRDFLQAGLCGAGALALAPQVAWTAPVQQAAPQNVASQRPTRFIFMHKGNGLFPEALALPTFSQQDKARDQRKDALDVDLDRHELPDWMAPLTAHKSNLTILQGLSGKMCTTGHHSWCSSLGVYRANERISSIKWATVDFELAKLFPSPLEHIELACFPLDGGNSRGTLDGIATGFSARGPQQPNYAFGSPRVAMQELFKSVSSNHQEQVQYQLDRQVLDFVAAAEARRAAPLAGREQQKVQSYAESLEAIRGRNQKVDQMADAIRQHVPQLDKKYLKEDLTTLDRQAGHTEVLLGALISGLTNVVAFTVDELGHHYTGIPGLEDQKVNMHDVGHGKSIGGVEATEIRKRCRRYHMTLIDTIVTRLKKTPEGPGNMFDNTVLCYFPDSGETHHSQGTEYPFIVLAGKNARLKLGRRYIRLPNYGQAGHKTLGNWYTTLLNAYGNGIAHFGDLDTGLGKFGIDQTGPIKQFLT